MNRSIRSGMTCLLAIAVMGSAAAPQVFADELPITINDYPRVVKRSTPKIQPGKELRVGPVRLHPSMQSVVEHDDNIRLTETNEESDVIFTQLPGILTETRLGDHRLTAGYVAEIIHFADTQEENSVNHIANAALNLDLGRLSVHIMDLMEDSTSRLFSEDSSREHTFLNVAEVKARYERPKWVSESGYRNNLTDYQAPESSEVNDRDEDIFSLLAGRKVATKTTVFVEGNLGQVDYDTNVASANHDYWQAFLGLAYRDHELSWDDSSDSLKKDRMAKVSAVAKVGYQERQLEDIPGGASREEFDGIVADASLNYRPKESELITLGYLATAQVSTFGSNEWYRMDRVNFSWKKRLLRKLYAIPRLSWQWHDYPEMHTLGGLTAEREDDLFQFQGELRYEPGVNEETGEAWMWASLFYTFRTRQSNFDSLEYDNSRVGVKVGITY